MENNVQGGLREIDYTQKSDGNPAWTFRPYK